MVELLIPNAATNGPAGPEPATVVTQITSPAPRDVWQAVLRSDPGATALQTPAYFDAVLAATGGSDDSRLYHLEDGRRLVLPLVRQRALPGIRLNAAFPGGYGHGGMLATGGLLARDVRAVVEDLRGQALSTRLDGAHHTAAQWAAGRMPGVVAVPRRVEVLDLAPGFDELRARQFSRDIRYHLRKAERAGVEVELDTTGRLVPVFHQIYRAWVDRWAPKSGLPPAVARRVALRQEPLKKFETVAAMLDQDCRVLVAWHRGQPVAAAISLVHGQHAIGWRSYSIKELAAPVSANILTQVTCVADACRSGCRYFDLGQSGGVTTLQQYKNSFGATPHWVVDLRIEPPTVTRLRSAKERAQGAVVAAIRRPQSTEPVRRAS
ncbi:MAG TPA: GNAT family N-acetyltransferase [Propionibacteriaceae bacterium]|nr:GNAT family N-acetyltransferase [Propionibacteriaceae bacterium]